MHLSQEVLDTWDSLGPLNERLLKIYYDPDQVLLTDSDLHAAHPCSTVSSLKFSCLVLIKMTPDATQSTENLPSMASDFMTQRKGRVFILGGGG